MLHHRPRLRRQLRCALAFALLLATVTTRPAAADDIVAVYTAFWAGLPAADIRLKLSDGGPGYHDEIEIATQGLPHLFTRFRATASAEGRRAADRPAEPSRYLAVYDLRKRQNSRVSMQFVGRIGGTIAERGPDDTSRKPPLAATPADGIIRAELTLRPIAGFKGETSEDGDPDDAPRKVELTVTDDTRMVPLSIKVPIFFMPLVVQFQRVCAAPDPCAG